jgi:DNA polymerase III subunit delta
MIIKSYEIQKKSLTNNYKFFLFYGENVGLKNDLKEFIKKDFSKKSTNFEEIVFYEDDIIENEENFYDSILSDSLFSKNRIIIINEATDKINKKIEDLIDDFKGDVCIIILSNILEKKSKLRSLFEKSKKTICVACYQDSSTDLEIIIKNELKKINVSLSRESVNLLIEKANNDRNNLRNEIEKIASFSLNKKKIEIDDIRSLINFSGDYKSDNFINECLSGNTIQYKKILNEFYTNTINQIFFLRMLNNKINRLLKLKEDQDNYNNLETLINTSKPPIFWKEKPIIKKQLSIWNLKDLKEIVYEINNIEFLCKKNPKISKAIFFDFFSKICKKANNFSL